MSNKPVCVLQAPLWTRSGYGDWALTVAKSLLRYDKFEMHVVPTRWGACSKKNVEDELNDPLGKALLDKVLRGPLNAQPELYIQVTIPNEFLMTPQGPMKIGKFNIGMTASIETTAPRAEWIEGLNRMDLNIAMTKHGKDVLAKAKYSKKLPNGMVEPLECKTPLEVLFWGADTRVYKKSNAIIDSLEQVMSGVKEDFAFLFVGQWTGGSMNADRKAIGWLIKTFLETFRGQKNPPCLVLKTSGATLSHMDRHECLQKIHEVTEMTKRAHSGIKDWPNIYLIHGELNDTEMNALYNHKKVKVHVSFTHGEGFGHPLLLSTLSGKPLLASNWSGHLDFLNPKYSNLLDGTLENIPGEAVNDWFIKEAQWFTVDYAKAGERMRRAFEDYSDLLPNAERLRAENTEKFSIEAMDKEFHALLDKYVPKFTMPSAIVLPKLKKLELPKLKPSSVIPASKPMTKVAEVFKPNISSGQSFQPDMSEKLEYFVVNETLPTYTPSPKDFTRKDLLSAIDNALKAIEGIPDTDSQRIITTYIDSLANSIAGRNCGENGVVSYNQAYEYLRDHWNKERPDMRVK